MAPEGFGWELKAWIREIGRSMVGVVLFLFIPHGEMIFELAITEVVCGPGVMPERK
jgi:hypothetical protein